MKRGTAEMMYKNGPTSISLFLFGHLSRLPPHRTKGVVCIQVLRGTSASWPKASRTTSAPAVS